MSVRSRVVIVGDTHVGSTVGLSPYKINKLLKLAKKRGGLLVTRAPRERLDGSMFPTAVYAFELEKDGDE